MATREGIGAQAAAVNAAFGTWIKFRGTPDVPPIAHTSGVSYQPAQHTLYKEFGDAFKSLPELLRGARNTYETYWEQAKKSADDYRKGKSLSEINAELDAGEVPLQYRPLLMSALEFRQGQESMQMAAQELTTKINSGEYADLSPMELDEATTAFMNDQLTGLQEAHGTTGGTDAFYNGYYSEVAKVREFAQQRNDQLVEQRRQQDIQIQVTAASNELGQTALSSADVEDGIESLVQTFNLDPISRVRAIEDVIKAAASNPNGVALINDMRSMSFQSGKNIRGLIQSGNIDLSNRPQVEMADGSIATVRTFSTNIDGQEVLLPTVSDDGTILSEQEAIQQYLETGKHLGIFKTPEDATKYAQDLHVDQERIINGQQSQMGQTLEQFFTKAYFDSAQIDAANYAFMADAEKTSRYLEELDRIGRAGAVGSARRLLQEAIDRGGNLETKEVQYARNALLQAQHQAEADAKRKAAEADVAGAMKQLSNKNGTVRAVYEASENVEDAKDKLWAVSMAQYNAITLNQDPETRKAQINQFNDWCVELINNDYKNIGAQVVRESLPFMDRLTKLTDGDKQFLLENPQMINSVVSEVDREENPERYNAIVNQMNNEIEIYKSLKDNMLISQVALQDSKAYLGHRVMGAALNGNSFQEIGLNLLRAENNAKNPTLSKAVDDMAERLARGKPWQAEQVKLVLATKVSSLEQLNDRGIQREALKLVSDSSDYIDTSSGRLVGTPIYGDTIPVSKMYLNELKDIVTDINGSLPEEMQFDMNFIKTGDISRLGGYLIQDRVATILRNEYEKATGSELPHAWGATQQDINSLLDSGQYSVKVEYLDHIGDAGDLLISIVDIFGDQVGNMSSFLAADELSQQVSTMTDAEKVRLISGGTGKSLESFKRKAQTQQINEEFKSLYPFQTSKYLYGYEAEALKGQTPTFGKR